MDEKTLIEIAEKARLSAYAPYSHFTVGAALETASGNVYLGCNVENASYSATCCAERVAFQTAIANGERIFKRIAIVGGSANSTVQTTPCMPCGICRQVMRELCKDSFEILVTDREKVKSYSLAELLPGAFSKNSLNVTEG